MVSLALANRIRDEFIWGQSQRQLWEKGLGAREPRGKPSPDAYAAAGWDAR
jgi:hypothetical protein